MTQIKIHLLRRVRDKTKAIKIIKENTELNQNQAQNIINQASGGNRPEFTIKTNQYEFIKELYRTGFIAKININEKEINDKIEEIIEKINGTINQEIQNQIHYKILENQHQKALILIEQHIKYTNHPQKTEIQNLIINAGLIGGIGKDV